MGGAWPISRLREIGTRDTHLLARREGRWVSRAQECALHPSYVRPLPRLGGGALHRRRGLAEQDRALLGGADAALVRVDHLDLVVGAHHGGARTDRFEPALEVREIVDLLALALV